MKRTTRTKHNQEKAATIQEALTTWKKVYGKRYCLHPQSGPRACSGQIVKAHTIQRSGGLDQIARDGHVYGFVSNFTERDVTEAKDIGINTASTFTGFCGFHDNKVFEPIEKHPFQVSQHHTFLLAYRALCRALFLKRAQLELMPLTRKLIGGKSFRAQVMWQRDLSDLEMGLEAGWQDLKHAKAAYDNALLKSDFSEMHYCVILLANVPDFLCCEAPQPEYDFNGRRLQDFADVDSLLDIIAFSIITTADGGAVVFSWLGDSRAGKQLVGSLLDLPEHLLQHAIVRFTYEHCENIYMSPRWWEGLDQTAKTKLVQRERTIVTLPNCLQDDGLRVVSWTIASCKSNFQ